MYHIVDHVVLAGPQLRICIDPRDLNTALQQPKHPMKTTKQVIATEITQVNP